MRQFDGLCKPQNNPSRAKSVSLFRMLKLDTTQKKNLTCDVALMKKKPWVMSWQSGQSYFIKCLSSVSRMALTPITLRVSFILLLFRFFRGCAPSEGGLYTCTLYLLACQVRVTVGDSGLCYCVCVTSFKHQLTPSCVVSFMCHK